MSFPLDFPSVGVQNMTMRLRRVVAVSESPYTLDTQTYTHQGARWEAEISLPPLTHSEAREIEGFIAGLKGMEGTFRFGNPIHTSSAVLSDGSVATLSGYSVSSAAIRAEQFNTGTSGEIPVGTHFQLLNRLYITTSTKADGSAVLKFQPPLREAITSSTSLEFNLPKTSWRLASNDVGWSINQASLYGFSFACVEAI